MPPILSPVAGPAPPARVWGHAARLALVGLLAPPGIISGAAAAGTPVPAVVRDSLPILSVLAFAASGVPIARGLRYERRSSRRLAIALGVTGVVVVPAYGSLTGLSGHEPLGVVVPLVVAAFALGFAAPAIALRPGAAWRCAAGGALGGLAALGPFLLAVFGARAAVPYVRELVVVASLLGCVIVPYRMAGAALHANDPAGDDRKGATGSDSP